MLIEVETRSGRDPSLEIIGEVAMQVAVDEVTRTARDVVIIVMLGDAIIIEAVISDRSFQKQIAP